MEVWKCGKCEVWKRGKRKSVGGECGRKVWKIQCTGVSCNLANGSFFSNVAKEGGAIFSYKSSINAIVGSAFANNRVTEFWDIFEVELHPDANAILSLNGNIGEIASCTFDGSSGFPPGGTSIACPAARAEPRMLTIVAHSLKRRYGSELQ